MYDQKTGQLRRGAAQSCNIQILIERFSNGKNYIALSSCPDHLLSYPLASHDRFPLPVEVGEALVDYLGNVRPACRCSQLILTLHARTGRSSRRRSPVWCIGPAVVAGWSASGGTGCATRWPARCSARAGTWSRSPRCSANPTWEPPPVTPGSTGLRCAASHSRGRGGAMSTFAQHAEEYLRLRRALGHKLDDAARLLPRFVVYLDSVGASRITVDVALVRVQRRDAAPSSSVWPHRMTVVRGFARDMSGMGDPGPAISASSPSSES